MRLLDTSSLELTVQSKPEPYAIFSHRWLSDEDGGEILFQELQGPDSKYKAKKGYAKIQRVCAAAKADGYRYIWMDTCCIDKTSSSETQEEITSMFQHYKRAQRCYVYLADVPSEQDPNFMTAFRKSAWFTRGWTLQELIAPSDLAFYARDWTLIKTKIELESEIAKITGIDIAVLRGGPLKYASVAQKLSWASNRETLKKEDMAYCLMGLFDVSIPLMYGEGGKKAFHRLQEAILKDTGDQSLFSWTDEAPPEDASRKQPFADSPTCFAGLGNVKASYAPGPATLEFQIVIVPSLKTFQLKDVYPSKSWIKTSSPLIPSAVSVTLDTGVAGAVLQFGHILHVLPSFLVVVGMKKSSEREVKTSWCNAIRDPGHGDLSKVLKSYTAKLKGHDFGESDQVILRKGLFPLGVVDVRVSRSMLSEGPKFILSVTVM
ncbi:hypothetical protein B7494_g2039 [Chlorociboria aeruginascens]|nr:hypothetical protein B7494_g2039 [Chlorociboria aeruginascens]